ncbi:MAG: folate-binding protein [Ancalomicrobiaceae bacterium]|nr:folate-binding protein [Ancalomicrobiaceae bacterium]
MTDAHPPEIARLDDRSVVSVTGSDATSFLHGLTTANIEAIVPGAAGYAALLSPQGKILFDFFVVNVGDGYLLDVAASQAPGLVKRLGMYRLRADVTIADRSADFDVAALIGSAGKVALPDAAIVFADPRLDDLGERAILAKSVGLQTEPGAAAAYRARRIALAVPEAGADFTLGEAVPHDVNFDDLGAVDFKKGCYVGQEIVSRMKHRGTARRRLVIVAPTEVGTALPAAGTPITSGEREIGTLGSSADGEGLAILRLDWAREAIDAGTPILAGDVALAVELPAYAHFGWPERVAT